MEPVLSDEDIHSFKSDSRFEFFKMYRRIYRVFGCFPVHILPSGSLSFTWLTVSSFFAFLITLMYFGTMLDSITAYIPPCRDENCTLSNVIVIFPPKIGRCISDLLIRLYGLLYCQDYIKLANILRKWPSAAGERMQKLQVVISVCLVVKAVHAIFRFGTLLVDWNNTIISSLCGNCRECEFPMWRSLRVCLEFWHQGAVLSATSFVAVLGFRLVKALQAVCLKMKAETSNLDRYRFTVRCSSHSRPARRAEEINVVRVVKNEFEELQAGFTIFMRIAGPFAMAIMVETITALLAAPCRLWYYLTQTNMRATEHVNNLTDNIMAIFLLFVIIETGDFMKKEVPLPDLRLMKLVIQ